MAIRRILIPMGIFLGLFYSHFLAAQTDTLSANESKVQSLVEFYQFLLNTVGSRATPTRDKEVIINESYKKVFADSEVQIEDDLLSSRSAIINKPVSAYLRDVDFFFQDIKFRFDELKIEPAITETGGTFYLVSFISTIDGTDNEGQPYHDQRERFIEINLNEADESLLIASVYTTQTDQSKALRDWWNQLSYEWSRIFLNKIPTTEVTTQWLQQVVLIDSLDLSDNFIIQDIEPLTALRALVSLDISSVRIEDLTPLRMATHLRALDISNTRIVQLDPLKYFRNLESLNLAQTEVISIQALAGLTKLKSLNLSGTFVADYQMISQFKQLKDLNLAGSGFGDLKILSSCQGLESLDISRTLVDNLEGIQALGQLKELNLSGTEINQLGALNSLPQLAVISISQTAINTLVDLEKIPSLRKVLADQSSISDQQANEFMRSRPGTLVVVNSQKIQNWWAGLNQNWKSNFQLEVGPQPSQESLVRLLQKDSLDISNRGFTDVTPLEQFTQLKTLNLSGNPIKTLDFVKQTPYLEKLNLEYTQVANLADLSSVKSLRQMNLNGTPVVELTPLLGLNKLETIFLENTSVPEEAIHEFLKVQTGVVIIFHTNQLKAWYQSLSADWKTAFGLSDEPNAYSLHELTEKRSLDIAKVPVQDLAPLSGFYELQTLVLEETRIAVLDIPEALWGLESLTIIRCPLQDLSGVESLTMLKNLNISNTAVKNLSPLRRLTSLESLDCSGTDVKTVRHLRDLINLKKLNISNTGVWQLNRLYDIRGLKVLICYNTRIRDSKVDEFKTEFPHCEVTYY